MIVCNASNVRSFIITLYRGQLTTEQVTDDFDLLNEGIIDSLGVLDLIAAIEEKFNVTVDLQDLDANELTKLGPLSDYVGRTAAPNSPGRA